MTQYTSLAIAGLLLASLSAPLAAMAQTGGDPMNSNVLTTVPVSGAGHGLCPRIVGNENGPVIEYGSSRC